MTSNDSATRGVHRELDGVLRALQAARQILEGGTATPDLGDLMGLAGSMAAIQEQLMAVNSLMVTWALQAEKDRASRRGLAIPANPLARRGALAKRGLSYGLSHGDRQLRSPGQALDRAGLKVSDNDSRHQDSRTRRLWAWNGSWNGSLVDFSAVSAISAISRAIGAASACRAWDRVTRKETSANRGGRVTADSSRQISYRCLTGTTTQPPPA